MLVNCAAKPTMGVIIAPPATPIIIREETSFCSFDFDCKANVKRIENTFAQVKPMRTIAPYTHMALTEKISKKKAAIAAIIFIFKNTPGLKRNNNIDPNNAPVVLAPK